MGPERGVAGMGRVARLRYPEVEIWFSVWRWWLQGGLGGG